MSKSINRSKTVKNRLLIICLILLCVLILIGIIEKEIGYRIKYRIITKNKINSENLIYNIQINEMDCAYDSATNVWYFPEDINSQGKEIYLKIGIFNSKNTSLSFFTDKEANRGTYKVDLENRIRILVYDDNSYYETFLQFSGLPIINIQTNEQEIGDEEIVVDSKIIDPYYSSRDSEQYIESKANIKLRGGTTKYLGKSPYKYELIKEDGSTKNKKLLGMRNDDDWVLDALYVDPSNIRNALSCELWNQINSYNTTSDYSYDLNYEFVEVFINNVYKGIYVLKEPVDAKTIEINKSEEAVLLKGNDAIFNYNSDGARIENRDNIIENYSNIFEVKYPKNKKNSKEFFKNSEDYSKIEKIIKYFDVDFEPDLEYLEDTFNLNCLIDYNILVNACQAVDNLSTKNVYYYIKNSNGKIGLMPWDLDMSWGLDYITDEPNPVTGSSYVYNYNNYNKYCTMYFKENAEEYNKIVSDRYKELRESVLSYENIESICNNYRSLLIDSGAYERDNGLYYNYDLNKEIDDMLNWYKNRIEYLDNYSY